MSDIQPGFNFSGASPNNIVTAANLNTLVGQAAIQPALITGKAAKSVPAGADCLLIWDSVSGALQKVSVQNLVPQVQSWSGYKNLAVVSVIGASNTQLLITADQLVMRNTAGTPRISTTFLQTLDLSVYNGTGFSGPTPNGRDFPSVTGPQWVYLWAISDGASDRTLFSLSAVSPTLPAGFTYSLLLGAWRVDASSHLVYGMQRQNSVALDLDLLATDTSLTAQVPFIGGGSFSSYAFGTAGAYNTVDLSRCIPPGIVARAQGIVGNTNSISAFYTYALSPLPGLADNFLGSTQIRGMGLQMPRTVSEANPQRAGFNGMAHFDIPIQTSQTLYAACDVTSGVHSMRITGFTLAL